MLNLEMRALTRSQKIQLLLSLALFAPTAALAFSASTKPAETQSVPGNMLLALSVEFPTGLQGSYTSNYDTGILYDGYLTTENATPIAQPMRYLHQPRARQRQMHAQILITGAVTF